MNMNCHTVRYRDHVDLSLQLQDGLGKEQVTVMVFARNYNILRFREGLGGQTASPQQPTAASHGAKKITKRRDAVLSVSRRACRSTHLVKRCASGRHVVRGRRSSPKVHLMCA